MTSPGPHRSRLRNGVAVTAETTATLAVALWLGGLLALGAYAAPVVFGQLERESAGMVMGTIFGRFDRVVVVLMALFAASEGVRVVCERTRGTLAWARLGLAVALLGLALTSSVWLGPAINDMFAAGVRRGMGDVGVEMDRLHRLAENLGKLAALCAAGWIALGIVSHRQHCQH